MHFSNFVLAVLPLLSSASVTPYHRPGPVSSEYYTLGCPNTTKPYASQRQQLQAITDYGSLLYLQKQIDTAEYTYVAKDFINHAPEVYRPSPIDPSTEAIAYSLFPNRSQETESL